MTILSLSRNHQFQFADASGGNVVLLPGVAGAFQGGGLFNGGGLSLGMTLPATLRNVFLTDHRPPPDPWPCPGIGIPETTPGTPATPNTTTTTNVFNNTNPSVLRTCNDSLNPTCPNLDSNHSAVTFPPASCVDGVTRFYVHKDHPPDGFPHQTAFPCPAAAAVTTPSLPSASFFELPVLPPGQPPPQAEPHHHHRHGCCDSAAAGAVNPSLLLLCCPPQQQQQQQLASTTSHCCSCCCLRRRRHESPQEAAAAAASSTSQLPCSSSPCLHGSHSCGGGGGGVCCGNRRQVLDSLSLQGGLTAPQEPSVPLVSSPPSPSSVPNKAIVTNVSPSPPQLGAVHLLPGTEVIRATAELGGAQKPRLQGTANEKGCSKEEVEVSGGGSGGAGGAAEGGLVGGGLAGGDAARALLRDLLQGKSEEAEPEGEDDDDDMSQDSGFWADVTVGSTDDDDGEWSLTGENLDGDGNRGHQEAEVSGIIPPFIEVPQAGHEKLAVHKVQGVVQGPKLDPQARQVLDNTSLNAEPASKPEEGTCLHVAGHDPSVHLATPVLVGTFGGDKNLSNSSTIPRSVDTKNEKVRPVKKGGAKIKPKRFESGLPVATRKNLGVKEPIGLKRTPMKVLSSDELCENDVLAGRGGHAIHNSGNRAFRELVEARLVQYANSDKNGKTQMATEIVERIRQSGGRFLSRLPGGKQKEDGTEDDIRWEVLPLVKARYKVSQRFRQAISAAGIPGAADRIPFVEEEG